MVGRTLMMLLRQVSQAHSSALTPAPTEMVGGVAYHKREEIPGHVFGPTVGVQQTPCLVQRVFVPLVERHVKTFGRVKRMYITFEFLGRTCVGEWRVFFHEVRSPRKADLLQAPKARICCCLRLASTSDATGRLLRRLASILCCHHCRLVTRRSVVIVAVSGALSCSWRSMFASPCASMRRPCRSCPDEATVVTGERKMCILVLCVGGGVLGVGLRQVG
jgi:hypothetical protein